MFGVKEVQESIGRHLDKARGSIADFLEGSAENIDSNRTMVESRIERLSKENYPEVDESVEKLTQNVKEKFPHEDIPPIFVIRHSQKTLFDKFPEPNAFYIKAKMTEKDIQNSSLSNMGGIEKVANMEEFIVIDERFINNHGKDVALGIIAHEIGHDFLDHGKGKSHVTSKESKVHECEADHFSAALVGKDTMLDVINSLGKNDVISEVLEGVDNVSDRIRPKEPQNIFDHFLENFNFSSFKVYHSSVFVLTFTATFSKTV